MNTANIENKDLPAFSCVGYDALGGGYQQDGLTKREYFAAKALQGLMTTLIPTTDNQLCPNYENVKYMADLAVSASDALLEALNK